MIALKSALPFLVLDLESALVHIGRGDVVEQLGGAMIERWTYDENADAAYLHLGPPGSEGEHPGETVSVYDELGINLETDGRGRLIGILIFGGKEIVAQLQASAISPRSP